MKKVLSILFIFAIMQSVCFAKDVLNFNFPDNGWHKVASPDGIDSKKCYVPANQSSESFNEMLTFVQKDIKNTGISPFAILQKQLGKDKNNYFDIIPEYIVKDMDNAMVAWCSQNKNTCVVERAFRGNSGVVLAIYTNKAPHYSQNMFGRWSNILGGITVLPQGEEKTTGTVEL